MDANQAVADVGELLNETLPGVIPCARLVARKGEILIVGRMTIRKEDILIEHLCDRDLMFGMSRPKWHAIEERIRELLLEGTL